MRGFESIIRSEPVLVATKAFNVNRSRTNQEKIDRQESDRYMKIYRGDEVVYDYDGEEIQKMQTEPEMSPEIKTPTQILGQKPKRKLRLLIRKYGTSEGAIRAWDTRGRGKKETSSSPVSSKQNLIDIAPYEGKDGEYIPLTIDQNKYNEYIGIVQQMDDIALVIEAGSPNKEVLQSQLLKLNIERSKLHDGLVEEATTRLIKENPKLPLKIIATLIHTAIGEAANRYITHKRAKDVGTA
jgi:hypothetical protein